MNQLCLFGNTKNSTVDSEWSSSSLNPRHLQSARPFLLDLQRPNNSYALLTIYSLSLKLLTRRVVDEETRAITNKRDEQASSLVARNGRISASPSTGTCHSNAKEQTKQRWPGRKTMREEIASSYKSYCCFFLLSVCWSLRRKMRLSVVGRAG